MKYRRIIKTVLLTLLALVVVVAVFAGSLWWYFHPAFERTDGIVYTQRHGHDLTFDVVRPKRPNGLGIVLMVSGGWRSSPDSFRAWMVAPLLRRGYTVLAVSHLSQPDATVMEIVADVNRAVRFIRHHARDYRIDPNRLGVTGGSAGGHLSLMLATRGGPGPADANDPADRQSSAVQAVAIFFPVTDLLNLGASTENAGDGGPPKSFVKAFGPQSTDLAVWKGIGREMSPIYHISADLPPILIVHGDADTLTPLEQSEWFQTRAREAGRNVELVVRAGKKHGWLTMLWDIRTFADWFDRHLQPQRE
ncbi:MAG: alpha/beta hydrolase [Sedimentisphaerales bacterium]|nr:alpha/beta hydrolase [Sedimentisphaerales bacterium]